MKGFQLIIETKQLSAHVGNTSLLCGCVYKYLQIIKKFFIYGFFIVNNGGINCFTKAGAFNIDAAGNLATSNGSLVMGWHVDENGEIVRSQVKKLDIMSADNLYSEPSATTKAYLGGNIDSKDVQLTVYN